MTIDTKRSPLVLLVLEIGDVECVEQWAGAGYLPTIASIMKRGSWGRTTGSEMICEEGIGRSLFSGISRSQHGSYYFRQLKPGTYDLQTISSFDDDGTLPFWSYLSARDKKVAIIDAPECRPLPGLAGLQLAEWAVHDTDPARFVATRAEPVRLLQELRQRVGPELRLAPFVVNSSFHEDRHVYQKLMEQIEREGALCRHVLARDSFDLIVIGFPDTHLAGHRFWKYRAESPRARRAVDNELTHAIRDTYQAVDRQMGLLLEQLPTAANVFVISLFGMKSQYPTTGLIESFCRRLGYQVPSNPSLLSKNPLALSRRIVPEAWRTAVADRLWRMMQERLLAAHFRCGTNWAQTTAFAIPSLYLSLVRVNLRGREPQGVVEPGAAYESLLDRLTADLNQLVDPHTGGPGIRQITRTSRLFGGGPPALLPDLFVEWQPASHFLYRVVHPKTELIQRRPKYCRDSYHSFNGFVAAAGPSVPARGAIGNIPLLDLAPTFLYLMGERVPWQMTGRLLDTMIQGPECVGLAEFAKPRAVRKDYLLRPLEWRGAGK